MKKIDRDKEITVVDPTVSALFEIEEANTEKPYMAFIPSFFTTASLPFKNVHKTVFVRKGSNGVTLTLTSPKNVPFGKYGRLLLSVLTTHAVLSKEKNCSVMIEYTSLADLLRELQLPKQRGSDIREQLECFSNAAFAFDQKVTERRQAYLFQELYEEGNLPKEDVLVTTHSTGNIRFTNGVQFKEIDDGSADNKYGYFKIILSPEFAGFCQRHAVPINYTVYKEITSAVGKDIYAWLVFRNNGLDKPAFISRDKLVEQFMPVEEGASRNQADNNFYKIIDHIKTIKEKHYPELKVKIEQTGITLFKSPTPVLKEDTRYALITSEL